MHNQKIYKYYFTLLRTRKISQRLKLFSIKLISQPCVSSVQQSNCITKSVASQHYKNTPRKFHYMGSSNPYSGKIKRLSFRRRKRKIRLQFTKHLLETKQQRLLNRLKNTQESNHYLVVLQCKRDFICEVRAADNGSFDQTRAKSMVKNVSFIFTSFVDC